MARYEELYVTKLRVGSPARDTSLDVDSAAFTIGAEGTNAITVNIQLKDRMAREMARRTGLMAYISSDATGDVLEATSATLSVAAGTDGMIVETSTDNGFYVISESDGDLDLVVTQTSGADTHYINLIMPDGRIVTSGALTFA